MKYSKYRRWSNKSSRWSKKPQRWNDWRPSRNEISQRDSWKDTPERGPEGTVLRLYGYDEDLKRSII